MIIMSLDEIRQMILFCKEHRVKSASFGDWKFEFSDYAFIDILSEISKQKEETKSSKTLVDTNPVEQAEEDEDLLYYSSNP